MPWAKDNSEQLWQRVDEVDELWNEEEQQSLREMTQNSDTGKSHASEVRVRVSHEHLGRIPVRVFGASERQKSCLRGMCMNLIQTPYRVSVRIFCISRFSVSAFSLGKHSTARKNERSKPFVCCRRMPELDQHEHADDVLKNELQASAVWDMVRTCCGS